VVLYHYLYPDDAVSARHLGDFCQELHRRGWDVEALPCNRGRRDESQVYPLREDWQGIAIRRVWRPRFQQTSGLGRVLNALWMLAAWSLFGLRRRKRLPDVLVIGTDPILSVLVALVVRRLQPSVRIAHWCFDLYPESAVVERLFPARGFLARLLDRLLRKAYASCDLVADLGSCMRKRLEVYGPARRATLVPWALVEPEELPTPDPAIRHELFGNNRLGLLYSGSFGRPHSFAEFLELARLLRDDGVHFCFGIQGSRADKLRATLTPDDRNVSLTGLAPESELKRRLAAADIHLASLRPEWTGLSVPSKFFGSLAAGRPVIFAGSREAAIARWIEEYGVGWVLDPQSLRSVAEDLRALASCPEKLHAQQRHCRLVYREHFSRQRVMDQWHEQLQSLLPAGRRMGPARSLP
jgi:glycosyltransferase involved in cell wall biosynthesis